MLLVLVIFEHVLAAATLIGELLAAVTQLKLQVSSREPLRVYGEHLFVVPPLNQCAAVVLFISRAQAAQHTFTLMRMNTDAVVELCRRLDGLPLAIELAAARSSLYTPDQILAQLGHRLDLLTGGPRDHPARQQTIRGALDWSYTMLAPGEQQLFARLGVFVGGAPAATIAAICLDQEQRCAADGLEVFDSGRAPGIPIELQTLYEKSLVRPERGRDGQLRFGMLETIRAYALERLAERGELPALQQRCIDYYLELAERAYPELRKQQWEIWLQLLAAEYDNLRGVLHMAIEQGAGARAVQISGALVPFWCLHGHPSEGCRWLEAALALDQPAAPLHQARALNGIGLLYATQGEYARAQHYGEAGLALRRAIGDQLGITSSLGNLAVLAAQQGHYEEARSFFAEVLLLEQAAGSQFGVVTTLANLGELEVSAGNLAEAQRYLEDSLALSRASGIGQFRVDLLAGLGRLALEQGDPARARQWLEEGLALSQTLGGHVNTVDVIEGLAGVLAAQGQAEQAAWLLGAAEAFREARQVRMRLSCRRYYQHVVQAVRTRLDEHALRSAWADGQALTLEQASALTLDYPKM
jgi:predicted ATPase